MSPPGTPVFTLKKILLEKLKDQVRYLIRKIGKDYIIESAFLLHSWSNVNCSSERGVLQSYDIFIFSQWLYWGR